VAEDKKKDGDGKADEGKKKKGLPPIVMIAVGAIVGGAGRRLRDPTEDRRGQGRGARLRARSTSSTPTRSRMTFNPRTKAGKGIGRVKFKFVYTRARGPREGRPSS
jgi:hypothetical protein